MKALLAVIAILITACASIEEATYKAYPQYSEAKRAECRAKAEPLYWEKATGGSPVGATGKARLEAADAFEACMEAKG